MAVVNICANCGLECSWYMEDEGCYEEAWGRPVWVPHMVAYSTCCGAEVIELVEDDNGNCDSAGLGRLVDVRA